MKLIEIDECKPGYILKGFINHKDKKDILLYSLSLIIFSFIGAISIKDFANKNILMSENHFARKFEDGTDCKIIFNNSHLVPSKLHKFLIWVHFELCGILSENGLKFVSENIENFEIESWNQYLQRTN